MTPPASDHFNGKTFFHPGGPSERGLLDVLRWQLTSRPARWPKWIELAPQPPPPAPRDGELVATWINHATFLLQTTHGNVLVDPVFSDRVSPVSWAGPRRVHAPGVALANLPRIDVVLVSHDHYDHCDLPSLRSLVARHRPACLAPLGHRELLAAAGATEIVELDWWQSAAVRPGLEVTLTPARHWTRREIGRANTRLWGGFLIQSPQRRVWFVGDSGYHEATARDVARRGAPDLALVPIGAYEPRWFMAPSHMNPAEAVQTHLACGARRSVAMHWGTFQLTDEGRDDPPRALAEARAAAGLTPDQFTVLEPGESLVV